MLLRVSSEMMGAEADLHALTDGNRPGGSGVPNSAALIAFAEAVLSDDDTALDAARSALLTEVGPEGFVDAAGVVGNFQRMVRIADATGIPLDGPLNVVTAELRDELGISAFGSADNTAAPPQILRFAAKLAAPLAGPLFRTLGRLYRR